MRVSRKRSSIIRLSKVIFLLVVMIVAVLVLGSGMKFDPRPRAAGSTTTLSGKLAISTTSGATTYYLDSTGGTRYLLNLSGLSSTRRAALKNGMSISVKGSLVSGSSLAAVTSSTTFTEKSGQVVIDAEHYSAVVARGGRTWSKITSPSGFSGSDAVSVTPNSGGIINSNFTGSSPELRYTIGFPSGLNYPRTYTVWVRGSSKPTGRESAGGNDSVHVGLDGKFVSTADRINIPKADSSWVWAKGTLDGTSAKITVPSAGTHTLNVWMREDGFRLDKIILTTTSSTPSGVSSAETTQGTSGSSSAATGAFNVATLTQNVNIAVLLGGYFGGYSWGNFVCSPADPNPNQGAFYSQYQSTYYGVTPKEYFNRVFFASSKAHFDPLPNQFAPVVDFDSIRKRVSDLSGGELQITGKVFAVVNTGTAYNVLPIPSNPNSYVTRYFCPDYFGSATKTYAEKLATSVAADTAQSPVYSPNSYDFVIAVQPTRQKVPYNTCATAYSVDSYWWVDGCVGWVTGSSVEKIFTGAGNNIRAGDAALSWQVSRWRISGVSGIQIPQEDTTASVQSAVNLICRKFRGSNNCGGTVTPTPTPTPTPPPGATIWINKVTCTGVEAYFVAKPQSGTYWYDMERCVGVGCSNFARIGLTTGLPTPLHYYDNAVAIQTTYQYRYRVVNNDASYTPLTGYSEVVSAAVPACPIVTTAPRTTPVPIPTSPVSSTCVNITGSALSLTTNDVIFAVANPTGADRYIDSITATWGNNASSQRLVSVKLGATMMWSSVGQASGVVVPGGSQYTILKNGGAKTLVLVFDKSAGGATYYISIVSKNSAGSSCTTVARVVR